MNIFERISLAARVAVHGEKALATIRPTWDTMQPSYSPINYEAMVRSGWRKNELINACISKRANTSSQVSLRVYKGDAQVDADHPLQRLLANPCPFMTEYDFWSSVSIFLDLAGVAYYEIVRSPAGLPVQLWPLRPDWTAPVLREGEFIAAYEYKVPGREKIFLEPKDVLRFMTFDPLNIFVTGYPRVAVAARVGDIDNAATDYIKLFWEKGGVPMGLLTTKQKLRDDDVTLLRKRWTERYGGFANWLEPAILDQDASYQRTGLTLTEMGFDALDARSEVRICAVMDVPPILVGAKVGLDRSTYSNYQEARRSWWQDSLIPQYEHYDDVINASLSPEFGDDIKAKWDFSHVPALQEDQNQIWMRSKEALQSGAISINEFREMVGLEPISGGDVRLISLAINEMPARPVKSAAIHEAKRDDEGDLRERLKLENIIEKATKEFLDEELERITKNIKGEHGIIG